MEAQAEVLGADAVIDVRIQVVPAGSPPNWHVLVSLAGTAIAFALGQA
jgi:uncharacterized protein YbjQ (UPF0145 family)